MNKSGTLQSKKHGASVEKEKLLLTCFCRHKMISCLAEPAENYLREKYVIVGISALFCPFLWRAGQVD